VFRQFAFLWTAILFVANIAVQLRRMHNEELVLAANFPEHPAYRRKPRLSSPALLTPAREAFLSRAVKYQFAPNPARIRLVFSDSRSGGLSCGSHAFSRGLSSRMH
jgi:hypothetical protein